MARVNIDGQDYDLEAGQNLLYACLSKHLEIPYFCWHPALGAVGSCRLCAIIQYADEADQRGRLQMACMVPVRDGMRISVGAAFAADFRKQVIEWLMENHPHDCPVCEEGGECHLQDMTVMTGHSMRRYGGAKRTWRNQYLGPFVGHEMNRCITCYRCVRFYRDYAGGRDLDAFGSRGRMFFGREEDGVLDSEFAGNLVEVCPTGVFTDKPFGKLYSRKWDLQSAPSLCPHCSVGCNTFPAERYGVLRRVQNRYHGELNGYFLCDAGRFGAHFVNHERRIRRAGLRGADGVFEAQGAETVLAAVAGRAEGPALGIGSPRASLEANFALRQLVGEANFCAGFSDDEAAAMDAALEAYRAGGFRIPTIADVEQADAVLILGVDLPNTAARMALAVRQAVRGATLDMAKEAGIPTWQDASVRGHGQDGRHPLFVATPASTRLDELAQRTTRAAPAALAQTGFAVAHAIDAAFPQSASGGGADEAFAAAAAQALAGAEKPLIIAGSEAREPALIQAAANIARALNGQGKDVALALTAMEANSYGVALLGGGLSLADALRRMRTGETALVLENDLYRRAPATDVALGDAVAIDALETPTAEGAAAVLPAATYAEQTGTFVNYEVRAQRFYQVFEPGAASGPAREAAGIDETLPAWRWIAALAERCGQPLGFKHVDDVTAACAAALPCFAGLGQTAPSAAYRARADTRIPRQPHRYSGRTAMRAQASVHEPKATVDEETPLAYSMEGQNVGDQPGALVPYVWAPGWNSNQSVFKFQQEVGGPLAGGDPGVRLLDAEATPAGAAYAPPPAPAEVAAGTHLAVSVHALFGSGELAAASAPVLERSPVPFVLLNGATAKALGVAEGDGVRIDELGVSLAAAIDDDMAAGVVGVAQGLPGAPLLPAAAVAVNLRADPAYEPPPKRGLGNVIARG